MKVKPSKRSIERVFVKSCDHNIQETLSLADRMIALANRGDQDREDAGCGILYGILRDSGYKLKKVAEKEKRAHIRKGLWKKSRQDVLPRPMKIDEPVKSQISDGFVKGPGSRHANSEE